MTEFTEIRGNTFGMRGLSHPSILKWVRMNSHFLFIWLKGNLLRTWMLQIQCPETMVIIFGSMTTGYCCCNNTHYETVIRSLRVKVVDRQLETHTPVWGTKYQRYADVRMSYKLGSSQWVHQDKTHFKSLHRNKEGSFKQQQCVCLYGSKPSSLFLLPECTQCLCFNWFN